MDKIETLRAICEEPGWQPPIECSSLERYLNELQREGWIIPRLDGWEASPDALSAYPHFVVDSDNTVIAEPPIGGSTNTGDELPVPMIARERVETMLRFLLDCVPVTGLYLACAITPSQLGPREGDMAWEIAADLAGRLAR